MGGVELTDTDRALGKVLARTEFWAKLPGGALIADGAVTRGLTAWTGGGPIHVKRRGEGAGIGRMVDVRKAVLSLALVSPGSVEDQRGRDRLGWNEVGDADCDICAFEMIVSTEASAKPREVLEGLWGKEVAADTTFARVALWADDGERRIDPLDCAALRKVSPRVIEPSRPLAAAASSLPPPL